MAGLDPEQLSDRAFGNAVTDHRSSWVRRATVAANDYYIKTYDYPSARDRWRGVGRTTWLAAGRAAREFDALAWFAAASIPGATPVLVWEWRLAGWLHRAVLVTEAFPGTDCERLAVTLAPASRRTLADAIERTVADWHRRGFRDGNLDLRNLLAADADRDRIAKIDSPRWRQVRAGDRMDRHRRADLARLAPQLQRLRG